MKHPENLPEPLNDIDIECWSGIGKGWWPLVQTLHTELLQVDPNYTVEQIKEKFGALRYYFSTKTENYKQMQDLVSKVEALSVKTCETCGRPGEPKNDNNWIRTACKEH